MTANMERVGSSQSRDTARHAPVSSPRVTEGLDRPEPLEDGRDMLRGGESGEARWFPFNIDLEG